MDLSIIDELPKDRIPITTKTVNKDRLEKIYSLFITKGSIVYENKNYEMGTFIKLENESSFNFKAIDKLEVFKVSSPKRPSYLTYFERFI